METLPSLWYPRCSRCGEKATPRAGLGDERGPRPLPHDRLTCIACGETVTIDEGTVWSREPLEAT